MKQAHVLMSANVYMFSNGLVRVDFFLNWMLKLKYLNILKGILTKR